MRNVIIVFALLFSTGAYAAESAGIIGMVITDSTVENNNFQYPKSIFTLYIPNDPSEKELALTYVAYKKNGTHEVHMEITDKNGKYIDKCEFESTTVTHVPYIHTITCGFGGRLPDGGIDITVYDKFNGNQEKIGGVFVPAKKQ